MLEAAAGPVARSLNQPELCEGFMESVMFVVVVALESTQRRQYL